MSLMIGEQVQPVVSSLLLEQLVDEVIPLIAFKADKIYVDPLTLPDAHIQPLLASFL